MEEDDQSDDNYVPVAKKTKAQPKKNNKVQPSPKTIKLVPNAAKLIKIVPISKAATQEATTTTTAAKPNGNNTNDLPRVLLDDPENAYGLHIAQQMRQFASFEREILRNKINNMVFTAFIEYQKRKKE